MSAAHLMMDVARCFHVEVQTPVMEGRVLGTNALIYAYPMTVHKNSTVVGQKMVAEAMFFVVIARKQKRASHISVELYQR